MFQYSNPIQWPKRPLQGTLLNPRSGLFVGLAAYFPFYEGSGAPKESFSGTSVTLSGTTSWPKASWPYAGPAFSGIGGGFATVSLTAINNWKTLSVAFVWMAGPQGASARVIEKGANSEWNFTHHGAGTSEIDFTIAGGTAAVYGQTPSFDGMWHITHGTYDGAVNKIYVDGIMGNVIGAAASVTGSTNVLNFFQYGGGGFQSTASLAALWIWQNRVLSNYEVFTHFRDPWQVTPIENYWLQQGQAGGFIRVPDFQPISLV